MYVLLFSHGNTERNGNVMYGENSFNKFFIF